MLFSKKIRTPQDFWNWFKKNSSDYKNLNLVETKKKTKLIEDFKNKLDSINSNLYFEIGDGENVSELIISAGGNTDYFKEVLNLVESAPSINGWSIRAFKPPMGSSFKLTYEGIEIDTSKIWFNIDLKEEDGYSIRIYFQNYSPSNHNKFVAAGWIVLDTILGERHSGDLLKSLTVNDSQELPSDVITIKEIANHLSY